MLDIRGEPSPTSCSGTNERIHLRKIRPYEVFEANIGSGGWTVNCISWEPKAAVRGPERKEVDTPEGTFKRGY